MGSLVLSNCSALYLDLTGDDSAVGAQYVVFVRAGREEKRSISEGVSRRGGGAFFIV